MGGGEGAQEDYRRADDLFDDLRVLDFDRLLWFGAPGGEIRHPSSSLFVHPYSSCLFLVDTVSNAFISKAISLDSY